MRYPVPWWATQSIVARRICTANHPALVIPAPAAQATKSEACRDVEVQARGEEESGRNQPRSGQVRARSVDPREVWAQLQGGQVRLLDLRTEVERRRYGAPPGAIAVSLARHLVKPEGEGAVYLCQHAVRSKLTLRNGAVEVAGGFVAWQHAGLPVATVQ